MTTYTCRLCQSSFVQKNDYFEHIRKSDCKKSKQLNETDITFGKYKDMSLSQMLRDRKYCSWLLQQEWFKKQYEYLYNKVKEYTPRQYFILKPPYKLEKTGDDCIEHFLQNYQYFYLCPVDELKIELTEQEKQCYSFYLDTLQTLKTKIENTYAFDIKAPTSWLVQFEKKYGLNRDVFKEFLVAYDLPNITSVVEDIKKMGGIDYKGGKAYLIAKEKSLKQEQYWETILKTHYGQDIGIQFKYKKCIFDFINTKLGILYECKLGLKDFDRNQYNKYLITLGTYQLIYLIGRDCIIDLTNKKIYTTNTIDYKVYLSSLDKPTDFEKIIQTFPFVQLDTVDEYFQSQKLKF